MHAQCKAAVLARIAGHRHRLGPGHGAQGGPQGIEPMLGSIHNEPPLPSESMSAVFSSVPFTRDRQWQALRARGDAPWDVLVVGGGATGLGVAVDAAARGFSVALVEAHDFAKGTSSRATKLVHGGVRYLAQGNLSLVREALHERTALMHNAPHLAQALSFVVPGYARWEAPFYGLGLKAYDALAGAQSLGATRWLSAAQTVQALGGVRAQGLAGGVLYWDGQFDDARLALTLAQTAVNLGAVVLNHAKVTALYHEGGRVAGAQVQDMAPDFSPSTLHHASVTVRARCVVNATGVWVDDVLRMDQPESQQAPLVSPSQGVHLVVDRSFLPGDSALMVPKTSDGRVLFAVPWLGKLILGTTDAARDDMPLEPLPLAQEVSFILREAGRYLARAPQPTDIRSAWAGLRPLVRPLAAKPGETKQLSREHTVLTSAQGLVTVTGGKWTTYRAMAEDVLQACMRAGLLPTKPNGVTRQLRLAHAPAQASMPVHAPPGLHLYGTVAEAVARSPGANHWLWRLGAGGLNEAMVRHAVRHEMAITVEDVLARRSRLLFLDAVAAGEVAEATATLMRDEARRQGWRLTDDRLNVVGFKALARQYAGLDPSSSSVPPG